MMNDGSQMAPPIFNAPLDDDEFFGPQQDQMWDGRREAYRMFGDKLWDQAKDEDNISHHGKHGKHHGKHHGGKDHHGKDHHGNHHFCPVMIVVYITLGVHFLFLKKYMIALSDLQMLT